MTELASKKCVPCLPAGQAGEGGVPPIPEAQAKKLLEQIPGWQLSETAPFYIEKNWKFKNFRAAVAFTNNIANLAEENGHHPDILIYGWNKVRLTLSTHAIDGLSENDFIMAAKINNLGL